MQLCKVRTYFESNWHNIKTEWVRGLKSVHLSNDTTNRVESFFSKLKTYFSPRSTLKETVSGLMSCLHSMRSERRYRQVKFINRVKMASTLDPAEEEYYRLLTPYTFSAVHEQFRRRTEEVSNYEPSEEHCQCRFFRCMKLPCRHIFHERVSQKIDLFEPSLVAERWTLQYNSLINLSQVEATITSSQATPR